MHFIESLCQPAYLYLLYIIVQVGLDLSLGAYLMAGTKLVFGLAGTYILDVFCSVDLGLISWVIIAAPFVITALATSIALGLNLDAGLTALGKEHFTSLNSSEKKNKDDLVGMFHQVKDEVTKFMGGKPPAKDKDVAKSKGDEHPLSSTSKY